MKKRFVRIVGAVAVMVGATLGVAQSANARIFPGTQEGPCIDGYIDVVHYGWFGSISSLESKTC